MKESKWTLNTEEVAIELDGRKIKVKQYLEAKEKSSILELIKEYSFNEQILDLPKLDGVFNALLILGYTDIELEFNHAYDLLEFYDIMESNSLVELIIQEIPKIEYNAMVNYYKDTVGDYNRFKESFTASLFKMVEIMPHITKELVKLSEEIDMDEIKTLLEITSKMR